MRRISIALAALMLTAAPVMASPDASGEGATDVAAPATVETPAAPTENAAAPAAAETPATPDAPKAAEAPKKKMICYQSESLGRRLAKKKCVPAE